ncbi:retron Ec78 anti-phage system effector ATPase PtuA [Vibrio gallaecicus]|uniref:retron Ec78 anti-phage system effector ATPase PtuA n=1 Tax=Vibrio gallaecicus TaxID=552386 RepID=UPI0010C942A4|nr:retron Ec78 anti-phage system effector ATPase PtuA [Vibrio gallaecicus]MDN3617370.1 retron Ec78 anti-phage system effector ATPase PtuA [Vibrio gallaecicus]
MSKINRSIRHLENNANNGNISSSFQLFQDFESGEGVNVDPHKAVKYFKQCATALSFSEEKIECPRNRITLKDIELFYFRKFTHLPIRFEEDITVFIGGNGSGKTTILEAIARTFSWINARIVFQGRNGRTLDDYDVTIGELTNSEVNTTFGLGEHTTYKGALVRPAKGLESAKSSKLEEYRNLSNLFRVVNSRMRTLTKKEIDIPLLAYYSVDRSYIKSNLTFDLEKVSSGEQESRFDVIDKSVLDGTGNVNDFLKWFIYSDNLSDDKEIASLTKIRAEISALESIVTDDSSPLHAILETKRNDENELSKKLSQSNKKNISSSIQYVKDAITSAVPSVSDLFVDRSSGRAEVRIVNEGVNINISQASKGQQVYIALIADIARRLMSLNPTLTNKLNGQGIILIDEVELHLHPEWQKNILYKLTSTFPNIQFIVTTHSPIVLSGVKSQNIRTLGTNIEGIDVAVSPLAQSYARSPSDVLETIMHVDVSTSFPETSKLEKYRKIVEQGNYQSNDSKQLRKELIEALGSSHEELVRLDMVVRRRELLG